MPDPPPRFYFQFETMYVPDGVRERTTSHGRWLPPKRLGHNRIWRPNNHRPPTYYFNGTETILNQLPVEYDEYSVCSLYYEQACIWHVNYDATQNNVEDGNDLPDSPIASRSNDDEEELEDWRTLAFESLQLGSRFLSSLTWRGRSRTLIYQRPDQLWVSKLFPDTYQVEPNSVNRTGNNRYGSLVGGLAPLIGICALSLPLQGQAGQPNVYSILPNMITRHNTNGFPGWQVPSQTQVPRGAGWSNKRGVVVTVFYDPDETKASDLRSYESGGYGPIFF